MTSRYRETIERVEFRWRQHEEEFAERLADAAREAGRSPSDHARELMKNALTSTEILQHAIQTVQQEVAQLRDQLGELRSIKDGLRTIHENIYQFRDDVATSVAKLLSDAGRITPDTAEKWVRETFGDE
jgi:hypothetical protein